MRLCPGINQPENDLVMTPPELARAIVDYFQPTGVLLDPCRGRGAFYNSLIRYSNDVHWCEVTDGVDFLTADLPKIDWIITNPPWSKMSEFLEKAFQVSDNVVYLATVTNFVTTKRLRIAREAGFGITKFLQMEWPPTWKKGGFQVAAAYFSRTNPNVTEWDWLRYTP